LQRANNHINPLGNGTLPGTLTLGRIKSDRNNYNRYNCQLEETNMSLCKTRIFFSLNFYSYGDTLNRNNLTMAQNNTFNTLGRSGNTLNRNQSYNDLTSATPSTQTNTIQRNNRYPDVPITNPLYR
jgi:protocadherin-15